MRHARHVAAALLSLLASRVGSAAPYKADAGPFAVQTTDQDWVDAARHRTVPVRLYLPQGTDGPQPIILLSHGLGGNRGAMAYAAEHWASYGYVCVAIQHPGSDESVWRDAPPGRRLSALRDAANPQQADARCADVHFVIDHLTELAKPHAEFAGRLDLQHIGIAGHSFGAQTVQAVLGQRRPAIVNRGEADDRVEPRIAAGIAFSPGFHGLPGGAHDAFAGWTKPCFHFTGTKDDSHLAGDVRPADRRVPYDAIDADDQFLMTFTDANHGVFNGRPRQQTGVAPTVFGATLGGTGDAALEARIHDGVDQASTAFWDMTLRGDPAARDWLRGDGAAGVLSALGTYEHKDATTRPANDATTAANNRDTPAAPR